MKSLLFLFPLLLIILAAGCAGTGDTEYDFDGVLTERQINAASDAGLELNELRDLLSKPLYEFSPLEVDKYLSYIHIYEPDLRKRIQIIAKKNLGQPYEIYLLGEFPFEIYDTQPLYSLDKSDCVVYSEHTYAMALSDSWKMFFPMLQRIRYKDGVIGFTTRNHYTEADWDVNNSWLLDDITDELAGSDAYEVTTTIDRANFFGRNGIDSDYPVESLHWNYIPADKIGDVLPQLKTGDFVNVVRGSSPDNVYVGHTGLISVEEDGTVNFIHSTRPQVKIQTVMSYMEYSLDLTEKRKVENAAIDKENETIRAFNEKLRAENNGKPHPDEKKLLVKQPYFYGFKFLRLREDALQNLREIDGPGAPKVTIFGSPE